MLIISWIFDTRFSGDFRDLRSGVIADGSAIDQPRSFYKFYKLVLSFVLFTRGLCQSRHSDFSFLVQGFPGASRRNFSRRCEENVGAKTLDNYEIKMSHVSRTESECAGLSSDYSKVARVVGIIRFIRNGRGTEDGNTQELMS